MRQRVLAYVTRGRDGAKEPAKYENHAFEVRSASHESTDTWDHVVHGDGDDAGLVFRFRWEPVRSDLMLFNRTDPLVEEL